jgi:hypothetical protein
MRRYVYSAILCAALALVWSARADDSALLTPDQSKSGRDFARLADCHLPL